MAKTDTPDTTPAGDAPVQNAAPDTQAIPGETAELPGAVGPGVQVDGQGLEPVHTGLDAALLAQLAALQAQGVDLDALVTDLQARTQTFSARATPVRPQGIAATAQPWHVLQPLQRDDTFHVPGPQALVWMDAAAAAPLVAAGVIEAW